MCWVLVHPGCDPVRQRASTAPSYMWNTNNGLSTVVTKVPYRGGVITREGTTGRRQGKTSGVAHTHTQPIPGTRTVTRPPPHTCHGAGSTAMFLSVACVPLVVHRSWIECVAVGCCGHFPVVCSGRLRNWSQRVVPRVCPDAVSALLRAPCLSCPPCRQHKACIRFAGA